MILTEEIFKEAVDTVLRDAHYIKGYRVHGLTVVIDVPSNSHKTSWDAVINFDSDGNCISIYAPYRGSLTPVNVMREIKAAIQSIVNK